MQPKYTEAFVEMIYTEFNQWDSCLCPAHGVWYRGPSLEMHEMQEPAFHAWFQQTYGIDLNDGEWCDYHDFLCHDWFPCPECTGNSEALEDTSWTDEPAEDMSDEDFNATLDSMFEDFDPRAELQQILSERRTNN